MKKLNVALIGQGFMGRAHSNAYRQVNHFFETPFDLQLKVICGRNQAGLEKWPPPGVGMRSQRTGAA
jgi:predicted dehydrogenase